MSVDDVETRQYRSCPAVLVAPRPNDRVALAVGEVEPDDAQVQFRRSDVAQEVLCREPQLALEPTTR